MLEVGLWFAKGGKKNLVNFQKPFQKLFMVVKDGESWKHSNQCAGVLTLFVLILNITVIEESTAQGRN